MVMMWKSESIAYQRKKLPSITWNGEDTTTLMVGSTIRKVFRLSVMAQKRLLCLREIY